MAVPLGEKVKTFIKLIKEPGVLNALISLRHSGYLIDTGWFTSFSKKSPFNKANEPIPWFTYPCNDFLADRLKKDFKIFEFGSGNSTLFFASRVDHIISVEHNKNWFELQKARVPSNIQLEFKDTEDYSKSILSMGIKFDVIIVDGIDRIDCILNSVDFLENSGVLILDDSERNEYKKGVNFLLEQGFKKIDFWGIAAGVLFKKCTTIFYKDQNCLKI